MKSLVKKLSFSATTFFLLMLAVTLGLAVNSRKAEAAAKPKLNKTSMTIPVGKLDKDVYWQKNEFQYEDAVPLTVKNKRKGASYTFTSSDTKIVKISKNGGYLTGVKKGKATITCKETYKGKTTVVGTCKVTVKDAAVIDYVTDVCLGSGLLNVDYFDGFEGYSILIHHDITYRNPNAKYSLKSDSKDFIFKETSLTEEEKKVYSSAEPYRYEAKKAGKYTLSVIETYNKKSRTIGKVTIIVHDVEISDELYEIYVNEYMGVFWPVRYSREDKYYYFIVNDKNVIELTRDEYNNLVIKGLKPGTAKVKVYEDSIENGRYLGEYTVKVKEVPKQEPESINTNSGSYDNFYDDYGVFN